MFSIKWNNGWSSFKTTYYGPFKQLNHCNAAWYEVASTDNKNNALKHTIKTIKYGLVSYDTPICIVNYHLDLNTNKDCFNIFINRESYRCSNTTIRQLSKFLRMVMGDLLTYQEIKAYDIKHLFNHDIVIKSYANIHLFWSDKHSMRYKMEQDVNATYCTDVVSD